MERQNQPKLVPYRCAKCGGLVIYTVPGAQVRCPICGRWAREQVQGTLPAPPREAGAGDRR